ncbi:MAG: type VII secretion-associated protein [Corynebacterium humireducens]|jgi:type VII secretion-associated protein (TIGR03931 family)|uniref:Type VII secretion-associated protein n=1 Tax=Corynebacterium humireducens TaxID=1223514 RepID=A0A7X6SVE1_9CORY|nr:type VII secretion-associated protein [Corynebacterium humireducens]
MSAPTLPGTLTITVLDTATIFEGPDTVYRYDLPGTGIIDGWALPAVLDQAKELCSLNWPDVEVIVDADDPTTEVLTRSLLNKGVAAYPSEVLREKALPEPEEVPLTRPTRRAGRHRLEGLPVDPFHVIVGVVVLAILGLSWWVVGGTPSPAPAAAPASTAPAAPPVTTSAEPVTSTSSTPEPRAVLEHESLRVEVPRGFHLEDREGLLLATGDDPDLRIRLAADPVFTVPPEEVEAQIHAMIDTDDTLHPLDPERAARGLQVIRYRETPGDGSEVTWHTWIEDAHQLSVGCHTRTEPTLPQKAACRMAFDSVELLGAH